MVTEMFYRKMSVLVVWIGGLFLLASCGEPMDSPVEVDATESGFTADTTNNQTDTKQRTGPVDATDDSKQQEDTFTEETRSGDCSGQQQRCAGRCVDLQRSSQHCGECGQSCAEDFDCFSGLCAPSKKVAEATVATNEARASEQDCGEYGTKSPVDPLQFNRELYEAAMIHARDMLNNDFFAHEGSDGSNFAERVGRTDYKGRPVAENIAASPYSPQRVVSRWIDSDGHCKNIMLERANEIGIGYIEGGEYGAFWVQVFGRGRVN